MAGLEARGGHKLRMNPPAGARDGPGWDRSCRPGYFLSAPVSALASNFSEAELMQ